MKKNQLDNAVFTDQSISINPHRKFKRPAVLNYIEEAKRKTEIFDKKEVLIIGGGPSGVSAAISAAKMGVEVALVERYNHLGGLSTGGLVVWIDRMTDWQGELVIKGFASKFTERIPKENITGPDPSQWGKKTPEAVVYWRDRGAAFNETITWSPTIDPEWMKIAYLDMAKEANVDILFHCMAVEPIIEGGNVKGVIFESKQGRFAILADIIIDTTGDCDIVGRTYSKTDSSTDSKSYNDAINVAWVWAGVKISSWLSFKNKKRSLYKDFLIAGKEKLGFFETPMTAWREDLALFLGPRLSGHNSLRVDDLTSVEIISRECMMKLYEYYRDNAPGFESAWIMLTAPQIGIRHSRRIIGVNSVRFDCWRNGIIQEDEIGVCPSPNPKINNISIPYGALIPKTLENVLVAGRQISCDAKSHSLLREIPVCWVTGQAAGMAAAISIKENKLPKLINFDMLKKELKTSNVYLQK